MSQLFASGARNDPGMTPKTHRESGKGVSPTGRDYSRLEKTAFCRERARRLAVAVVGAGALGNEVIKNLALLGVGRLAVFDRDRLEASNLTRSVLYCMGDSSRHVAEATPKARLAAIRAKELNPDVQTGWMASDIAEVGASHWREFDLVFSCLDNARARLDLSRLCLRTDRLLVDGGLGLANSSDGLISIFPGRSGPCYACRKGRQRRAELIAELYARTVPCWAKDAEARDAGFVATTPLLASAVAAFQVELGLRAAFSAEERTLDRGEAIRLRMHPAPAISRFVFDPSPNCPLHFDTEFEWLAIPGRSDQWSVRQLLDAAGEHDSYLALDGAIVCRAVCPTCQFEWSPMRRRRCLGTTACPACGDLGMRELDALTQVERDSVWAERSLTELGLPTGDLHEIVTPRAGGRRIWVELTGDSDNPGGGVQWD